MRELLTNTFLGLLLCLTSTLEAQPQNLYFHHLDQFNGLFEQKNSTIYTDSKGLTWISSTSGLNCFNGVNVINFTPNMNDPCAIKGTIIYSDFIEDDSSNIWFSSMTSLECWKRKENCFKSYQLNPGADFKMIGKDENDCFWIYSGYTKISKFDPKKGSLDSITHAKGDRIFCGMEKNKLRYIFSMPKNNHINIVEIKNGRLISNKEIKISIAGNTEPITHLHSVYYSDTQHIWLGTDLGLICFNLQDTSNSKLYKFKNGNTTLNVMAISNFVDDKLLIGTNIAGLYVFDTKLRTARMKYDPGDNAIGLLNNGINSIIYNAQGILWVTFTEGGVCFSNIHKSKFGIVYNRRSMKFGSNAINYSFFHQNNNGLFLGTNNEGLYRVRKNGKLDHYFYTPDIDNDFELILGLSENTKHSLYSCMGDGHLCVYDTSHNIWKTEFDNLFKFDFGPTSMIVTQENKLLFCGYRWGLFAIDLNAANPARLDTISPDGLYFQIFESKKGYVYVSRNSSSIDILGVNKLTQKYELIHRIEFNGFINFLYNSSKTKDIFIATSSGIMRLNEDNFKYTIYGNSDGLANQNIQAILEDNKGLLWVSTRRGISRFNPYNRTCRNYSLSDGLQGLEFTPAACKLDDGSFLFGGANGANIFDPEKVNDYTYLPIPFIASISINDRYWKNARCSKSGATNFSEFKAICLPYAQNTITFDFLAIDYADPLNNRVAYRLEGYDSRWDTLATASGKARYAQLREGTYTFQVIGANSDGVWNPVPREIEVEILPPFYRTLWFYLLEILVLGGFIGGGTKLYVDSKLRAEKIKQDKLASLQRERDRIASEMHDDVGAGLTSIRLISDRIQRSVQDQQLQQQIKKITVHAGDLIENMSSIIWAMNSSNDTYEGLFQYLRKYALEYLTETNDLNASFPLAAGFPQLPISGERRRQIFLAFKESLHNIVKHADAGSVAIQVVFENERMKIRVADDGKGIPADRKNGNGLVNMAKRMEHLGGHFAVKDNVPQGTVLEFEVPL